ncbi:hypothetical protein XH88_25585 [Bradyrhizobium sp. CCBAU 51627]|nr:hypothetical protein [Bradyrhizobium sp. CCBAU 51627]
MKASRAMIRRADHRDDFACLQDLREGDCGWHRQRRIRSIGPVIDGLLAATAMTHDLRLVTQNDRDVAGLGGEDAESVWGG